MLAIVYKSNVYIAVSLEVKQMLSINIYRYKKQVISLIDSKLSLFGK